MNMRGSLGLLLFGLLAALAFTQGVERLPIGPDVETPSISADGQVLAYCVGHHDVYVLDRKSGSSRLVSKSIKGGNGNRPSYAPAISGDGQFVVFTSEASDLIAGDTNSGVDVFVASVRTGKVERVSVSNTGRQASLSSVDRAAISGDGRFVAFASNADNLVAGDDNHKTDIFVRDRQANTTVCVSRNTANALGNGNSLAPAISDDGQVVAFCSYATNLVKEDTNQCLDIFVRDAKGTVRASVSERGYQVWEASSSPTISSDGRYVAFQSTAPTIVARDANGKSDVFVFDRESGEVVCASVANTGDPGNDASYSPVISANGNSLLFSSRATDLVTGDTNNMADTFLCNLVSGLILRVSRPESGEADGASGASTAISADGSTVVFDSAATNMLVTKAGEPSRLYLRTERRKLAVSVSGLEGPPPAIAVAFSDVYGQKDGSGSFERLFSWGTPAVLTAPESVGGLAFDHWEVNGTAVEGSTVKLTVGMTENQAVVAFYQTRRVLTIRTVNPDTGIAIQVETPDKSGRTNDVSGFERVYTHGAEVVVTAPAVVVDKFFRRWELDGVSWKATRTVTVPMWKDRVLTAVYGDGMLLRVDSNQSQVDIQVWQIDKEGLTNGTTGFTRLYMPGQAVSMTAPVEWNRHWFSHWEMDGRDMGSNRVVRLTMDGPHTLRVVYR